MTAEIDPLPLDSDEARTQLDEGLKSCRSVVQNYRLMLTGNFSDLHAANDQGDVGEPRATDA